MSEKDSPILDHLVLERKSPGPKFPSFQTAPGKRTKPSACVTFRPGGKWGGFIQVSFPKGSIVSPSQMMTKGCVLQHRNEMQGI